MELPTNHVEYLTSSCKDGHNIYVTEQPGQHQPLLCHKHDH